MTATRSAWTGFWQGRGRLLGHGAVLLLLAPFAAIIGFAFVYPLGRLLVISVTEPEPTLGHYAAVAANPVHLRVLLRTLWIGTVVTTVTLFLAYPVAYAMSRARGGVAAVITACVLLPFWSSVLVRTAAWSVLLQREGLINKSLIWLGVISEPLRLLYTEGAVVLGMAHVMLPFMIFPIFGAIRGISDDYLRAAAVMGAGPTRVFWEVLLPLSLPGVYSGVILVFLTSLGFFITPALLGSPQQMMVSTLISQQIREVLDWPFAAALVVVLTLVVSVIALVFNRAVRLDRLMGEAA